MNANGIMNTNGVRLFLGGIVLILLYVNGLFLVKPVRLLTTGERTQGRVVEMVKSISYSGKSGNRTATDMYSPTVEFVTSTGERVRIGSAGSSSSPSVDVGDAVTVMYNPSHPQDALLLAFSEFFHIIFLLFFTVPLIAAVMLLPGSRRKLKKSGVPAIATVLEANPEARFLRYRIDKENRLSDPLISSENLDNFISLEQTLSGWKPSQADASLKKGEQFRAYLDKSKPDRFYIDFSDRIGYNPSVKSMEEESSEEEEEYLALAGKLGKITTICTPYLPKESLSEIAKLIEEDEFSPAFEKLVTSIMNLPKPLPAPLQNVDWDDYLKLGVDLGLDEEVYDDPEFWAKFQAFKKAQF